MTRTRRNVAVWGLVAIAVYVLGAAISGRLSPLARKPLLDGLAPQPYRWVDPPPALADANQPPVAGSFRAELADVGSRTAVFSTDDNAQATVILEKGAFPAARGQDAVEVTITPIAASEVSPAEAPLSIVGNVIRIEAAYVPSGDPAAVEPGTARIVLVYPVLTAQHGGHAIVTSPDGRTWTAQETNDLPSIRQADALVPILGYVAVAEEPAPPASPSPGGGGRSVNTVATVAIVAALAVLGGALTYTLLGRRPADKSSGRKPKGPGGSTAAASRGPAGKGGKRKRR